MIKNVAIGLSILIGFLVILVIAASIFALYLGKVKGEVRAWGEPMNMLSTLQIYSEGYLAANKTYESFCSSTDAQNIMTSVISVAGKVDCNDGSDAWAAGVILPIRGSYYCVDSIGNESTTVRGLASGETSCPATQPW